MSDEAARQHYPPLPPPPPSEEDTTQKLSRAFSESQGQNLTLTVLYVPYSLGNAPPPPTPALEDCMSDAARVDAIFARTKFLEEASLARPRPFHSLATLESS